MYKKKTASEMILSEERDGRRSLLHIQVEPQGAVSLMPLKENS